MNRRILRYRLNGIDYTREFSSMEEAEIFVLDLLQSVGGDQIDCLSLGEEGEETDSSSPES